MSALAWLFGLGALAVAFPFLFHLIRRTPKGQVHFSSLMFVRPSPPRLTRRSRLENLLLLALRMAAIALIAAAFMRPFFRDNVNLSLADVPDRKVAVMLDTSASMRRGDLWTQALDRVNKIFTEATEKDDLAIYTFDSKLTLRSPFGLPTGTREIMQRTQLQNVRPGWRSSDLGSALATLADELDQDSDKNADASKLQLIVVSDMQAGSSTSALQNFQWPAQVKVALEAVSLKSPSNATLELLPATEDQTKRENVIVKNSKDSQVDQFAVSWSGDEAQAIPFYVPPGTNKILPVPRRTESLASDKLVLAGDAAEFDNQFFVVPPRQQKISVAYLGNEAADDPDQMLYYFERCLFETPVRVVEVSQFNADRPFEFNTDQQPELVVVTRPVLPGEQQSIENYLGANGSVFVVLHQNEMVASTANWTKVITAAEVPEKSDDEYALLAEIQFRHPIFEPFAGPRFNDFTQIRFWQHLDSEVSPEANVIARFDNGSPAMWHVKPVTVNRETADEENPNGDVYVLATGWQPSLSQLALSSKFLPIINRVLELASRTLPVPESCVIGQPIKLPGQYRRVEHDGQVLDLDPSQPIQEQIDAPGVYRFTDPDDSTAAEITIAINLDPAESHTEIMPLEQITAFDVEIGQHTDAETEIAEQRKLRDLELESKQKLWKWLIVAAIGFLIVESWLAGRTDRVNSQNERVLTENAA